MKNISIILLVCLSIQSIAQNTYTKRNELKTVTQNNVYTVYTYDELGNMKTKNVSIIAGATAEITNEFVEIEHLLVQEEVEITISDGVDGKHIKVYNEHNELVWEYFNDLNTVVSEKSLKSGNDVIIDVQNFEAGFYYVNVFDTIGVQLARKQIEIKEQTNVEETILASEIAIYPNPTNGALSIDFGEAINQVTSLTVNDLSGKLILKKDNAEIIGNTKLILNNVISGTYLISIYADDTIIKQEKVVVIK